MIKSIINKRNIIFLLLIIVIYSVNNKSNAAYYYSVNDPITAIQIAPNLLHTLDYNLVEKVTVPYSERDEFQAQLITPFPDAILTRTFRNKCGNYQLFEELATTNWCKSSTYSYDFITFDRVNASAIPTAFGYQTVLINAESNFNQTIATSVFDLSQIDALKASESFAAGFSIFLIPWLTAFGFSHLLRFLRGGY